MFFLDSSFFIALIKYDDEYHPRARTVFQEISTVGETMVFSEAVLAEVTTFLCRKSGHNLAYKKSVEILDMEKVSLLTSTEEDTRHALEYLLKHSFLSYADALSVALMQKKGIKKIVSFDSDFDRVKEIQRIY